MCVGSTTRWAPSSASQGRWVALDALLPFAQDLLGYWRVFTCCLAV
jgi:hypothetical protein